MAVTPNSSSPGGTRTELTGGSELHDYFDSRSHSQYLAALPALLRVAKEVKCAYLHWLL